jgi:hypothetical protein
MGSLARKNRCNYFIEQVLPQLGIIPGSGYEETNSIMVGTQVTVESIYAEETNDETVHYKWTLRNAEGLRFVLWGEAIIFDPEDDDEDSAEHLSNFASCEKSEKEIEELLKYPP